MANDVGGQHVSLWDDRRLDLQRLRKQGHDPCKKRVRESSWTLWRGPARDTPDPFQLGPVTVSVV